MGRISSPIGNTNTIFLGYRGDLLEIYQEFAHCQLVEQGSGRTDVLAFTCLLTGLTINQVRDTFAIVQFRAAGHSGIDGLPEVYLDVNILVGDPSIDDKWDIGYTIDEKYVVHIYMHTKNFYRGPCCFNILAGNYEYKLGRKYPVFGLRDQMRTMPEGYLATKPVRLIPVTS